MEIIEKLLNKLNKEITEEHSRKHCYTQEHVNDSVTRENTLKYVVKLIESLTKEKMELPIEITQEVLKQLEGKTVKVKYKHYSYHDHFTTRTGEVKKYGDGTGPFYMVDWGEATSSGFILEILN